MQRLPALGVWRVVCFSTRREEQFRHFDVPEFNREMQTSRLFVRPPDLGQIASLGGLVGFLGGFERRGGQAVFEIYAMRDKGCHQRSVTVCSGDVLRFPAVGVFGV